MRRRLMLGGAVGAGLIVATFAPFWAGLQTLEGLRVMGQPGPWPTATGLVYRYVERAHPWLDGGVVASLLITGGFLVYLVHASLGVRDARSLLAASSRIGLAWVLVASPVFYPWYAVLPIALVALTAGGALPRGDPRVDGDVARGGAPRRPSPRVRADPGVRPYADDRRPRVDRRGRRGLRRTAALDLGRHRGAAAGDGLTHRAPGPIRRGGAALSFRPCSRSRRVGAARELSRRSALLTDLYELTMAQAYWLAGRADVEGVFSVSFRRAPFGGGFALACGLEDALAADRDVRRSRADDLAYLATLRATDGIARLPARLPRLSGGVPAQPGRGRDPGGHGRSSRSSRSCASGAGCWRRRSSRRRCSTRSTSRRWSRRRRRGSCSPRPATPRSSSSVCGARRAPMAGLTASRAAFIGGVPGHVQRAGRASEFGIPVRGTHAHSWVLSFDSEAEAFRVWAETMPQRVASSSSTRSTRTRAWSTRSTPAGDSAPSGHELAGHPPRFGRSRVSLERRGAAPARRGRVPEARGSWPRTTSTRRRSSRCGSRTRRSMSGASARGWSRPTASPRSAASTSSPRCASRTAPGGTCSRCRSSPTRRPCRASWPCGATTTRTGTAAGDAIVDELTARRRPLVIVHPTARAPSQAARGPARAPRRCCCR